MYEIYGLALISVEKFTISYSRSSGPGGQNVNKRTYMSVYTLAVKSEEHDS